MIYVHSLGGHAGITHNATALVVDGAAVSLRRSTSASRTLRLRSPPTALRRANRLALLLPNSPEYIELVYACSWLALRSPDKRTTLRSRNRPSSA